MSDKPNKIKLPSLAYVVARSYPDNVIGCDNKLPWRLRTDLRRFKKLTLGHAIIMGRKTFGSIGQPLPNRCNIVLSREKISDSEGVYWTQSHEDALHIADCFSILNGKKQIFIVGGSEIYKIFDEFVNLVYLTEVFTSEIECGDAFFDMQFDRRKWNNLCEVDYGKSEYDEFPFRFVDYEKRNKTHRDSDLSKFMKDPACKEKLLVASQAKETAPRENDINSEETVALQFA